MDEAEQAKKEYDEATSEWNRLADEYDEVESKLAEAEYDNTDEVDISELQKQARERKALADEALNRQIDAINTLSAMGL